MKRAKLPINRTAARAADEAIREETSGRALSPTNSADANLRKKWLDAYAAAGGVTEQAHSATPLKSAAKQCPVFHIELQYRYVNMQPVAGAKYVVASNTGAKLYSGILDADGRGVIHGVPEEHRTFVYYFHRDPLPYEPTTKPSEKPSEEATKSIFETIISWIWGTLQGDFNPDPSMSQIAVNTVLGLIPLVDQALDIRDIIAGLKHIIEYYQEDEVTQNSHPDILGLSHEVWLWLGVFLIALGCIPELGSLIKGVLKAIINYLSRLGKRVADLDPAQIRRLWETLVKVLNDLGMGNANDWLKAMPGKLDGWMAEAATKIKAALDAIDSLVKRLEGHLNDWIVKKLLTEEEITSVSSGLKRFKQALAKAYSRLDVMKAKVNAWIREQLEHIFPGSHKFEQQGIASTIDNPHTNTRVQESVPVPDLILPPLHANNLVKNYWKEWPEGVRQAYMDAQRVVEGSSALVRKMSDAELDAIQRFKKGQATIEEVFPKGAEGNKAFALDRRYEFSKAERNASDGYEATLEIPLNSGLREYLLQNMIPDKLGGKMPADLKDLPRFKLEQDGYTILIPRAQMSILVKYIR